MQRKANERLPFRIYQQIKSKKAARSFGSEALDAALGGMDALQQRVERKMPVHLNDDLAVENEFFVRQFAECFDQLRKVSAERLSCLGLQQDLIGFAKSQAAEAVPLGLIEPAFAAGDLFDRLCFHRRERRLDR